VEAREPDLTRSLGLVASGKSAPALMSTDGRQVELNAESQACHLQALHYLSALHRPQDCFYDERSMNIPDSEHSLNRPVRYLQQTWGSAWDVGAVRKTDHKKPAASYILIEWR